MHKNCEIGMKDCLNMIIGVKKNLNLLVTSLESTDHEIIVRTTCLLTNCSNEGFVVAFCCSVTIVFVVTFVFVFCCDRFSDTE